MGQLSTRQRLADVVARWQQSHVIVVGDSFIDEWWYGQSERLSREAPVPVVALNRVERAPGGAANAAVNLAALGARPLLVAPMGDDAEGEWLRGCLTDAGVEVAPTTQAGRTTPVKRRVIAGGQIVLRVDSAGTDVAPPGTTGQVIAVAETALDQSPVAVVVCDYAMGALSEEFLSWLGQRRDALPVLAVDAHQLGRWREARPTVVKPNFAEATELIRAQQVDHQPETTGNGRLSTIERHGELILDGSGAGITAVTLDLDGALVLGRGGRPVRTPAREAPESHAVGAGDAYLAALTLALASSAQVEDAADLAQLAADASIRGPRTCVTDMGSLLAQLGDGRSASTPGDVENVIGQVRTARARGARLVFTNGCFDVLHHGHVGFLSQARELGDLLVVGLNSDASVARLKGPGRPVNNIDDRLAVLSALSCVDHVVVFEEDSPEWLIEELRPDIYVKGGDYHADLVPEAAVVRRLGGEVRILDYLPDRSTSSIIEKIRSSTREDASRTQS
jgi:rfaE bifunctional protein nucleotidyltransferase chain/domain/rfaE bifunctional protein kinase chain/domain